MSRSPDRPVPIVVQHFIPAPPQQVFAAWTDPEQLRRWWGPPGVDCVEASVDLRVGGGFRLANQLPGGQILEISGEYHEIDPPHTLRHTWRVGDGDHGDTSFVTVAFRAQGEGTDVEVRHENVTDPGDRASRTAGWQGCLAGLEQHLDHMA